LYSTEGFVIRGALLIGNGFGGNSRVKNESADHLNLRGMKSQQSLSDQSRFGVFDHYKPLLFSIAYPTLGRVADAEGQAAGNVHQVAGYSNGPGSLSINGLKS
jgi:hypothetical protein